MTSYSIALFLHFVFLLTAVAAATLAGFAALRLRDAQEVQEARRLAALIRRVTPAFPVATVGLLASGAYMTYGQWGWSTPWVVAGVAGLALIVALGMGVEGRRGRETLAELGSAGLSQRARRLLRDPIAWSAKGTTWSLLLAVVFVMTAKPPAAGCVCAIVAALVAGPIGARPFWRPAPA
jgi:hypothetical protein